MIKVEHLTKKIGEKTILRDLNFTANRGEILGLLGPNGAGKTTTMKIICTYWQPSFGKVEVGDLDVVAKSLAVRKKIGYLPETVPLYDDMKVFEYLKFIAQVRDLEPQKVIPRIKEVIQLCGLNKVIGQSIEQLSKGYRQRVGLAQAILHDPEVLILDEPTTGLDPNQIVEIRELIKQLGKEKTVIFSTHILAEASATCDRVVIINHGKIVAEGKPEELANKAGDEQIIYTTIKGNKDEVAHKIRSLATTNLEILDEETSGIYNYKIKSSNQIDLRETIFNLAKNNNWILLELKKESVSLEEVFKELTK